MPPSQQPRGQSRWLDQDDDRVRAHPLRMQLLQRLCSPAYLQASCRAPSRPAAHLDICFMGLGGEATRVRLIVVGYACRVAPARELVCVQFVALAMHHTLALSR